jgi:CheY-like chemotaxis protein
MKEFKNRHPKPNHLIESIVSKLEERRPGWKPHQDGHPRKVQEELPMFATTEEIASHRPCLLLAHADPTYASRAARSFRRLGWDVYEAHSGPEARRLARMLEPALMVLGTDLPEESGWLTCDKLTREFPLLKVILVGDGPDVQGEHFAAFTGAAALINRADGAEALLHEVHGAVLPVAG